MTAVAPISVRAKGARPIGAVPAAAIFNSFAGYE